ncbi:Fumarate reductase flavoprotein subunit [Rubrobacter xylanophilus DSM 9941]|uniref:FAD-dependent oxidoreductase n=1 Tax=Rubrobacter xylanophilus TaxID=49319 RepID=UPI001C6444B3|nr:FAD-dependent oxidoreductase [Rubrobacter xylanophilus]QYJ16580.1 Fumarate reductase flavoprotein subunit [Rubrobacter xylanophilus DSM 9941]
MAAEVRFREGWPVVVVGAGGCGMVAALAASRRGGQVLVLEKGAEPGGNTALSTGLIPAAGTRFQRAAGVPDDTPELMAEDIFRKNRRASDPALTRHLCETSAGLVEWLADEVGCELVCHTDFLYPGHSRFRMHGPPRGYGAELVRQLARAVEKDPSIELRLETPVRGLVLDDGRVVGVRTGGGSIEAGAVILALDGFGGNPEMVRKHLGPGVAAAPYFGSPNNTGDGIRWGIAAGAATGYLDAYQGHGSVAVPDGPLVTWGLVMNGAVLVNRHGRRFGDESRGYSEFAREVLAQPGGEAWEIFDQRAHDASRGTRFEEVISAGRVERAETPEELAATLGLPAAALAETVATVNRVASGEEKDPFGRDSFAGGLSEPPFYGIHVRGALFHTQGGLKVDTGARVLRPDGRPIPGLYAGGGTAAGISGNGAEGYLAGNGLLAALGLGRIAGENALPTRRTP